MNHETQHMLKDEDIVRFRKSQRLEWFGHEKDENQRQLLAKPNIMETIRDETKRKT